MESLFEHEGPWNISTKDFGEYRGKIKCRRRETTLTRRREMSRNIKTLCPPVNCIYGAPMGRRNVVGNLADVGRVYDCAIPLDRHGYDRGGAYWGIGRPLRCKYTKDFSFVNFYRA